MDKVSQKHYIREQCVFTVEQNFKNNESLEATGQLDDFINRQNSRIWDSENTHAMVEKTNASTTCHGSLRILWMELSLEHNVLKMRLVKQRLLLVLDKTVLSD